MNGKSNTDITRCHIIIHYCIYYYPRQSSTTVINEGFWNCIDLDSLVCVKLWSLSHLCKTSLSYPIWEFMIKIVTLWCFVNFNSMFSIIKNSIYSFSFLKIGYKIHLPLLEAYGPHAWGVCIHLLCLIPLDLAIYNSEFP